MNTNSLIGREKACKQLNISIRTLERYVKKYSLSKTRKGRKVLLFKKQISDLEKDINSINDIIPQRIKKNIKIKQKQYNSQDVKIDNFKNLTHETINETEKSLIAHRENIFRDIIIDLKDEIKEKDKQISAAFFKIGELQEKIRSMVPFMDYRKKMLEIKNTGRKLLAEKIESGLKIKKAETKAKEEWFNKIIYIGLIFILLIFEILLIISFFLKPIKF